MAATNLTRADLDALAASDGLTAWDIYAIEDEGGRLAVANSTSTYGAMAIIAANGDLDVSGVYKVDGLRVVKERKPGWGGCTGFSSRAGFETTNVTLPNLAKHVKALLDDLTAHGLIGS